ncbi:uncharacterized protein B0P05DRAFT_561637, partial [Gilbertella persicaria]|uniref:uncharacterized protein n=1 Tax=Gilbertella persicaria TaxID=101096 RepID=UPI00221FD39F
MDQYKLVEHNDTIYQIPIRMIDGERVVLLSDAQSILPNATAFLTNSKLVPFKLDSFNHREVLPKRVLISDTDLNHSTLWQIHVPQDTSHSAIQSTVVEIQIKLDQLSEKLDRILSVRHSDTLDESSSERTHNTSESLEESSHIGAIPLHNHHEDNTAENLGSDDNDDDDDNSSHSSSPPPAFSIPSSSQQQQQQQHEAPPSYETSVLSTIKSLNDKLRLYESHISNRHKSPKWMAKRQEWISREPSSIEQTAYQLVQLEMALLWTAVTESWIQERETWLTLVASSRSERHLAGAIINLERHTLVMDQEWAGIRERWINELLEMVVLPLSHG